MKKLQEWDRQIEPRLENVRGLCASVKRVAPHPLKRSEGKAKRVLDLRPKE